VATDLDETGVDIEDRQLQVAASVVAAIDVPVTVKLSPFYTALPNFVPDSNTPGRRGCAVFNRFYQPDVDPDTLDLDRHLHGSPPRPSSLSGSTRSPCSTAGSGSPLP
jgi:dihydroorotate dehydrogenase (fumarate)